MVRLSRFLVAIPLILAALHLHAQSTDHSFMISETFPPGGVVLYGEGSDGRAHRVKVDDNGALVTSGTSSPGGTAINWQGAYASGTTYAVNDAVSYNGSSYIAIASSTGQTPSSSPSSWGILALAGTNGQGFNFRGAWATNTAYALNDVVTNGGSSYVVTTAFTSGSSFSTTNLTLIAQKGADGSSGISYPVVGAYFNGNSYMAAIGATDEGHGQVQLLKQDIPLPPTAVTTKAVSGLYEEQIAVSDLANFVPSSAGPIGIVENGVENNANTNACTVGASSNCITNFLQAQRFALVWKGLPKAYWLMASTASPVSGPWNGDASLVVSANSGATGTPIKCSSASCVLNFTVPATNNGHIFGAQTTSNTGTGTYTITIGGVLQTNPCTGTTVFSSGPCGGQAMLLATAPQANEFYNAAWAGTSVTVTITQTNANNVGIIGVAYVPQTRPANMNLIYVENGSPAFDPAPGYFSAASVSMVTNLGPSGSGLLVFPADVRTAITNYPGGCFTGSTSPSHPNSGCYVAIHDAVIAAETASGYVFTSPNSAQQGATSTGYTYAPYYGEIGFTGNFAAMHHWNRNNQITNFAGGCIYDDGSNAVCDRFISGTPLGGSSSSYIHDFVLPANFAQCISQLTAYSTGASSRNHCVYADGHVVQNGSQQAPQFIATQTQSASIGTALASATTIALVTPIVHVTGTAAISAITPPTGCTTSGTGCRIVLIPDGAWTLATGGTPSSTAFTFNMASTATVGREMDLVCDPASQRCYQSY